MCFMSGGWWEYVHEKSGRALQKDMAQTTGIEQSNFSRWKKGKSTPLADHVVTFARAYRQSPVEALIAAGYLKTDEVGATVRVESSVHDLPTSALLDELQSRYRALRGTPERGRRKSDRVSVGYAAEPTIRESAPHRGEDEDSTGGLGAVGRG